ncbi:unnamed protein product [Ectocarpus sp. 8 AP-2014]
MTDLHESGLYVLGLLLPMVLVSGAIIAAVYAVKSGAHPEEGDSCPLRDKAFRRAALLQRARDFMRLGRWEYAIQDLVHYINDVGPLHPALLEAAHDLHDCLLQQQDAPLQHVVGVQPSPVANYRRRW